MCVLNLFSVGAACLRAPAPFTSPPLQSPSSIFLLLLLILCGRFVLLLFQVALLI